MGSCAFTGVLMTEVLGMKVNGERRFLMVDAAMTEVIRPALYGAHHPVTHVTIPSSQVSNTTKMNWIFYGQSQFLHYHRFLTSIHYGKAITKFHSAVN